MWRIFIDSATVNCDLSSNQFTHAVVSSLPPLPVTRSVRGRPPSCQFFRYHHGLVWSSPELDRQRPPAVCGAAVSSPALTTPLDRSYWGIAQVSNPALTTPPDRSYSGMARVSSPALTAPPDRSYSGMARVSSPALTAPPNRSYSGMARVNQERLTAE